LENPHRRNLCAASWALKVDERNQSPAANPQMILGMISFFLKLSAWKQPTPVQHSPSVGKGETEAWNLLCTVEGKKTPDFLS